MHKLDDILLNMKQLVFLTLAAFCCSAGLAQTVIPLYKDPIPNSKPNTVQERSVTDDKGITRIHSVTIPTLTVFQPEKEKPTAPQSLFVPAAVTAILPSTTKAPTLPSVLWKWA